MCTRSLVTKICFKRSSTDLSNGGMSLVPSLPEVSCSPLHHRRYVTQAHPSWQRVSCYRTCLASGVQSPVCPFENAMVVASCVSDMLLACCELSSQEICWSPTDRPCFVWARKKQELILQETLLKHDFSHLWGPIHVRSTFEKVIISFQPFLATQIQ